MFFAAAPSYVILVVELCEQIENTYQIVGGIVQFLIIQFLPKISFKDFP